MDILLISVYLTIYFVFIEASEKDTFYLKEFCFCLTADLVSIGGRVDDAEIDNKFWAGSRTKILKNISDFYLGRPLEWTLATWVEEMAGWLSQSVAVQ